MTEPEKSYKEVWSLTKRKRHLYFLEVYKSFVFHKNICNLNMECEKHVPSKTWNCLSMD